MPPILEEHISPVRAALAAFSLSAVAGIIAHLRETKVWTILTIGVAGGSSGFLGTALFLLWWKHFQDNIQFLMGVCILAGLCGRPMVDAVTTDFITIVKRRLGITVNKESHDSDPPNRP